MIKGIKKEELINMGIKDVIVENGRVYILRKWRKNSSKNMDNYVIINESLMKRKNYYCTITFNYNGKKIHFTSHRIVYCWFNGDIPDGYDVDHIDNNSMNNDPSNLQLLTRRENLAKRFLI